MENINYNNKEKKTKTKTNNIMNKNLESFLNGKGYKLIDCIGEGGFGKVYSCFDIYTNTKYAVKISRKNIEEEIFIQHYLTYNTKYHIISQLKKCFKYKNYYIIIMELMDTDLYNTIKENNKIEIIDALLIAKALIVKLEILHSHGYIHRDIKPHNILINISNDKKSYYFSDLGFCTKYIVDNKHIEYSKIKKFIGTFSFCSLNTHNKIQHSRRDDIESFGYTLVYLVKGKLPWQYVKNSNKNIINSNIAKIKKTISVKNELCKNLPYVFEFIIEHGRQLKFNEEPNYNKIFKMITYYINKLTKYKYPTKYPANNLTNNSTNNQTNNSTANSANNLNNIPNDNLNINHIHKYKL